ncbi:flocculation protein FLO11-like [Humulus lupulus]|uniref:flocculation protein FLO11-like n=1 Tax=Humulus lupulus TaxID=3486 RepID=UPI002B417783|nr:flocculation protein FLO11-like [Humulus lupulus]
METNHAAGDDDEQKDEPEVPLVRKRRASEDARDPDLDRDQSGAAIGEEMAERVGLDIRSMFPRGKPIEGPLVKRLQPSSKKTPPLAATTSQSPAKGKSSGLGAAPAAGPTATFSRPPPPPPPAREPVAPDLELIPDTLQGTVYETTNYSVENFYKAKPTNLRAIKERSPENVMESSLEMNLTAVLTLHRSISRARSRNEEIKAELATAQDALAASKQNEHTARAALAVAQASEREAKFALTTAQAAEQEVKAALAAVQAGEQEEKNEITTSQAGEQEARATSAALQVELEGAKAKLLEAEAAVREKKEASAFSMENMPAKRAFDLYTKSASKKKSHRRQSGEGCSNQPAKNSRTDDPPASTPTREKTPPPAPTREATPPTPTNPDLPSLVGQTPPPAPVDPTPPTSIVQQSAGRRKEASGDDLTTTGVLTLTSGWRSSRTHNAQFEKKLNDQLSAAEAQYTEQLKVSEATYAEQLKAVDAKHSEALKEVEVKHNEALKKFKTKHLEALQVTEAIIVSLKEELKRKDASIDKITASKEQYKELLLRNFREAHKLQDELAISRQVVAALEDRTPATFKTMRGHRSSASTFGTGERRSCEDMIWVICRAQEVRCVFDLETRPVVNVLGRRGIPLLRNFRGDWCLMHTRTSAGGGFSMDMRNSGQFATEESSLVLVLPWVVEFRVLGLAMEMEKQDRAKKKEGGRRRKCLSSLFCNLIPS